MNPRKLFDATVAATGVTDAKPLTSGGQKWVLEANFADRPVVVKIVPIPEGPHAPIVLERAHREVDLLAAVDSPFVVAVLTEALEISDGDGPPIAVVWVEERLDGVDLSASKGPKWTDDEVYHLLRDLAEGLQACHEQSVVHRDLSPQNVRVTEDGRFVVMDPGLARHLEKLPITGMYQPGTPGFRSPEHVPGGSTSPASDIFCIGILAYYLRTGSLPIDPSGTDAEYDARLRETQTIPIRAREADVDDRLASIIDCCLNRQPARRYMDGAELLAALADYRIAGEPS